MHPGSINTASDGQGNPTLATRDAELTLGVFGHHPDADIDFGVEVEVLEGMAYEVKVGLQSQWPFWSRLSRALRLGREGKWFDRPDLEPILRSLEHDVADGVGRAPRPPVIAEDGPGRTQ